MNGVLKIFIKRGDRDEWNGAKQAMKVKSALELPKNGGFINNLTKLYCKWKPTEKN